MSKATRGPAQLPDPRRLQADRNRHRHAARLGAPSWRRHARPRRSRADVHGRRRRAPAAAAAAPSSRDTASGGSPGSATIELRDLCRRGWRRRRCPAADPARRTPLDTDRAHRRAAQVRRRRPSTRRSRGWRRSSVRSTCSSDVLMPVLAQVGDDWHRGRDAHRAGAPDVLDDAEHARRVSPAVRAAAMPRSACCLRRPQASATRSATLGAAMLAASSGLGVAYLGADLPAREIVESVEPAGAQVLVLGLTTAVGRQGARTGASRRSSAISRADVELWAGGRGAERHASIIRPRGLGPARLQRLPAGTRSPRRTRARDAREHVASCRVARSRVSSALAAVVLTLVSHVGGWHRTPPAWAPSAASW